jgi:hypothetical protein
MEFALRKICEGLSSGGAKGSPSQELIGIDFAKNNAVSLAESLKRYHILSGFAACVMGSPFLTVNRSSFAPDFTDLRGRSIRLS